MPTSMMLISHLLPMTIRHFHKNSNIRLVINSNHTHTLNDREKRRVDNMQMLGSLPNNCLWCMVQIYTERKLSEIRIFLSWGTQTPYQLIILNNYLYLISLLIDKIETNANKNSFDDYNNTLGYNLQSINPLHLLEQNIIRYILYMVTDYLHNNYFSNFH